MFSVSPSVSRSKFDWCNCIDDTQAHQSYLASYNPAERSRHCSYGTGDRRACLAIGGNMQWSACSRSLRKCTLVFQPETVHPVLEECTFSCGIKLVLVLAQTLCCAGVGCETGRQGRDAPPSQATASEFEESDPTLRRRHSWLALVKACRDAAIARVHTHCSFPAPVPHCLGQGGRVPLVPPR